MKTKEIAPLTVIYHSQTTTLKTLSSLLDLEIDQKLLQEAAKQEIKITGPIIWNYYGTDGNPNTEFRLEIAYPVDKAGNEGQFKFKTLPSFKCASLMHEGSWATLKDAYEKLIPEMAQRNMQLTGNCREIYNKIVSPTSSENLTEVLVEYI